MKILFFDDFKLGVAKGDSVVDVSGAVQDMQLFFTMGYRVANAAKFPEWRPGNEFRAIREKQLAP